MLCHHVHVVGWNRSFMSFHFKSEAIFLLFLLDMIERKYYLLHCDYQKVQLPHLE